MSTVNDTEDVMYYTGAQDRNICPSMEFRYNLTNELDAEWFVGTFSYSWTDTVVHTIILPFILSAGLLGNFAFLFVVSRIEWMRTITNCYLVNLALADMTFLVVSIGEKLHQYTRTPFVYDDLPKGATGCVLVPFAKDFCFFSSILLVTCISVERFNAACRPLKQRRNKGAKLRARTAKLTAMAWVLSLAMASLRISASCCQYRVYCLIWPDTDAYLDYTREVGECRPAAEWVATVAKSIQLVLFTVAMGVNTALYVRITRAVQCTKARPNARHHIPCSGSTSAIEAKITRMVVATGVIFFLCLAPYELFSALVMVLPTFDGNMVSAMQVCRMLMHLNSAINPFIYNVANPRYRKAFRLAFTNTRAARTREFRESVRETQHGRFKNPNQSSTVSTVPKRRTQGQSTQAANSVTKM
ncbi:thyrotropin-releasing hormone receptor-like [Patiria miniata]|uniref:G-protein coupled receptors family 1 profile domain-containing protein n=1 Tax=Patiria miniata TaxID=46514 RepID=A0A914AH93_PATMI|nr:thyrotropin-releasing hormone receptor-like [Patiria miniata]